jgi:putative inorganic carbon (HCO3(-)) transporter
MGFLLTLLFLVFSYVRPGELFPELASYRIMLWVGILAMAATAPVLLRGRWFSIPRPQIYLMLALMGAVSLSVAAQGWLGGALLAFEEFGITAAIFFLVVLNVNSLRRFRVLVGLLVFLTLGLVIQVSFAYHYGYMADVLVMEQPLDTEPAEEGEPPVVEKRVRSLGVLNDPNDLAQALLTALPFLALAWRGGQALRNSLLVVGPGLAILYGVYLTRSRGGLLSLVFLIFFSLLKRLGRLSSILLTGVLAVLLVAAGFIGGRRLSLDDSGYGRLQAWSEGLMMLRSNPILGVGFRNFTDHHEITAHNSFVLCFAELGLAGYFLWLALLALTIAQLRSLDQRQGDEKPDQHLGRRLARATLLALSSYLAAGFFLSRTYQITLFLILAMGVALVAIAKRSGQEIYAPRLLHWCPRVAALEAASIAFFQVFVKLRLV